ncbi:MAG: metal ABC transporter ATP-binding protein [Firmicutes bacterium]|nr:metal ABC transporter ATP-binding protein [Bacillota bacterium]
MKHIGALSACAACCTQIRHVSVKLEGLPVLEDVSLHMHCGEMTAIIGPNGGGKTTLFKAILRQAPYQGEITFQDAAGGRVGRPRIGYVPQHLATEPLAPVTVLDFMGAALSRAPAFLPPGGRKRECVREALRKTGAEQLLNRRLGALSGGEAQRVLLALALSPMPNLLLLDEPVSGIDAEGLASFYHMIDALRRDLDITILLISHDFAFVRRYADRAVLLHHRVLAHGKPSEVFAGEAFAALFPGYAGRESRGAPPPGSPE